MLLRSVFLFAFCFSTIKSQAKVEDCTGLSKDNDFPNLEKYDGTLSAMVDIDKNGTAIKTEETFFPSKEASERRGTVKSTKDGSNVQYAYFYDSKEYFRATGYTCESRDIVKDVLLDDAAYFVPKKVVDINKDVFQEHLGAFSLLRLGFASRNDLVTVDKNAKKWRQCIQDQLSIDYTLNNDKDKTDVVIKMKTDKGVEVWSYTFEIVESGDDADHAPIGSGCKRRNPTRPESYTPISFETEIILEDNRVNPDGSIEIIDSETVTLAVYESLMSITAKAEDGGSQVRNVVDGTAGFVYSNAQSDKCSIESLMENLEKDLKIPYTSKEKANLLSPSITNVEDQDDKEQYSFEFLGTAEESELLVYERVIDNFYNDDSKSPAIVTHYVENKLKNPYGTKQQSGPTKKIQIKVFEDGSRKKITKNIFMDYQLFTEGYTDEITKFNVRNCFTDTDVATFRITFDSDMSKNDFTKQRDNIVRAFIDAVSSTVSVVRFPRIDLQRNIDTKGGKSIILEGDILERPKVENFFTKNNGRQVIDGMVDSTITSESGCISSCYDDSDCQAASFCGDKCSKSKSTAFTSDENCNSFLKQGFYQTRVDALNALSTMVKDQKLSLKPFPAIKASKFDSDIKVDPNALKFPDIEQMIKGQTAFSTHIEKVDIDSKTTSFYHETRDTDKRRGALRRVVEDISVDAKYDQQLIFFYDTDEYFAIRDFVCDMKNISDKNFADFLTSQNILPQILIQELRDAGFQPVGPSILMDYGKDLSVGDSFKFEDVTYNGIQNVKKWPAKNTKKGFQLDYYFYTADFGLSPVAVEVFIKEQKKFIYNFADFAPEINVHRFRSLPISYGCQRLPAGRKELPAPVFISEYKQTLELVMYKFGEKRTSKINTLSNAISTNFKLTVFVPRNNTPIPHPMRKVIDENNDLIYVTDLFTGRCQIQRKPDMDIGQWPDVSLDVDYNVLDTRIFMLTDDFQYLGEGEQRGVPVDIFEVVFPKFSFSDLGNPLPAVITHYIPSDIKTTIPMKIVVRIFNTDKRETVHSYFEVNIHDFQELTQDDQKEKLFDISNCFMAPEQYMWFQVQFIDDIEGDRLILMPKKKAIEAAFRDTMETKFGIPPSRLPRVIVDESEQGVFITAKLLERAPFTYGFKKTEKKQVDETFGKDNLIASEDKCGQKCYEDEACIGFSYCANFECAPVYKDSNVTFDKNLMNSPSCNAYEKLNKGAQVGSGDSMIDSLLFMFQELTANRYFTLSITESKGAGPEAKVTNITLTAVELKQNVEPGFSREYEERIHLPFVSKPTAFDISKELQKSYYVNKRNRRLDYSKVADDSRKAVNIEIGDCKKLCDDDPLCKTFSYCTSTDNECIVSNLDAEAIINNITTTSQSCSILSKYYTAQYEKRMGYSVSTAKTSTQVPSAEECARSCSTESNFNCLSFDVCDDGRKKTCFLHTYHLFVNKEEAAIATQSDCDHYSKKFTFNFTAAINQKFKEMNEIETIKTLSAEECAHNCFNNDECTSFEFCENVDDSRIRSQCRTTSTIGYRSRLELHRNCTVYVRSSINLSTPTDNKEGSSGGYSKGLGGFLAVLLFVVGAALGVVAIWLVINKLRVPS